MTGGEQRGAGATKCRSRSTGVLQGGFSGWQLSDRRFSYPICSPPASERLAVVGLLLQKNGESMARLVVKRKREYQLLQMTTKDTHACARLTYALYANRLATFVIIQVDPFAWIELSLIFSTSVSQAWVKCSHPDVVSWQLLAFHSTMLKWELQSRISKAILGSP